MLRDAYFPKGMLSFLGKMAQGCKFIGDSIFPVTPAGSILAAKSDLPLPKVIRVHIFLENTLSDEFTHTMP